MAAASDPPAPPTLVFIGVSTAQSAAQRLFPQWAAELGLPQARLQGIDLPLDAPPAAYREVVQRIKHDPSLRGALITSHKINLLNACRDLIDAFTPEADFAEEISCLYKSPAEETQPLAHRRNPAEMLIGHAVDAEALYAALAHMVGQGYWAQHPTAHILCLGAGGAASALAVACLRLAPAADQPVHLTFVDIAQPRLERLRTLTRRLGAEQQRCSFLRHSQPEQNDALLAALPPGSLIINATGLGKDQPGSPITDAAIFPHACVAWEMNYRGELGFLRQAQAAGARAVDGWDYFLRGWKMVMERVFPH